MTIIYHGTPITPRSALLEVCKGRAMCVSFFRPDDVEAVEAISPAVMFRQRSLFNVEGGTTQRRGVGRALGLVGLLWVARTSLVPSGSLGGCSRYARRTEPAQRCTSSAMAVWSEGRTALAHGWTYRTPSTLVQSVGSGLHIVDGQRKAPRSPRVSRAHGRSGQGFRKSLACYSHDARPEGGLGLPILQCRRDNAGSERVAV
jgi:hypothetical protein